MKAPFQIKRFENAAGGYDFELRVYPTLKLVCAEYRCKSPIPPKLMLHTQARLNTMAVLDCYWPKPVE